MELLEGETPLERLLGSEHPAYEEEIIKELNTVVSEIYSPPRVTEAARLSSRLGISIGFAMDITANDEDGNPWDFDREQQKSKAEKRVLDTCPDLLVGSPMCKDFSPWQRLNEAKSMEPEKDQKKALAIRLSKLSSPI